MTKLPPELLKGKPRYKYSHKLRKWVMAAFWDIEHKRREPLCGVFLSPQPRMYRIAQEGHRD